ncbi:barstar family protein [Nocardioides rubriscoriae]|uniref:barstar family protein n=1 Tax=Nocardioides rubriscoriae TaxID=642762 RepID=UPI001B871C34|nr:barstar family protein [Nocardioides rubriscoriae]
MSGLAGLLAGRTPPGAYRWHAAYDVADVRHTVELAGRRFAHVDGAHVATAPELHDALAAALGFPDWYGRNLDALHDCLGDLPGGPGSTVLLWDAWGGLARAEPRVFGIAVELLEESLTLLLRGPGPDLALPWLD